MIGFIIMLIVVLLVVLFIFVFFIVCFMIVVDDWCPSSGRAPADDLQAVRTLISTTQNTRLILTSKAYESPSADEAKWKSRGSQLSGLRQVWLLREEGIRNYRKLIDEDLETRLKLKESGFTLA